MENQKIVNDFINFLRPVLEELYFRWESEKGFENFADYESRISDIAEQKSRDMNIEDFEFIQANSDPFGFIFKIGTSKYSFEVDDSFSYLERII